MKLGKISPAIWKRSVKKQLHKRREDVTEIQMYGTYSEMFGDEEQMLWADAQSVGHSTETGVYAVRMAVGNLAAQGIATVGISVNLLFPTAFEEQLLSQTVEKVEAFCEVEGIQVSSVKAEGSCAVNQFVAAVTAVGRKEKENALAEQPLDYRKSNVRELVYCGFAGLEGTLRILEESEEELSSRFVNTFLKSAKENVRELITPKQIFSIFEGVEKEVRPVVRQVGSGGVLAALWELAETEKLGFEISMQAIPLKQETVEVCEFYRLNPYQMTSAGSYLILTEQADRVIEVLEKSGARAVRLGVAKAQNARVITSREEVRYLDRPAPDELARWQAKRM